MAEMMGTTTEQPAPKPKLAPVILTAAEKQTIRERHTKKGWSIRALAVLHKVTEKRIKQIVGIK
jgi:hypothetical protein